MESSKILLKDGQTVDLVDGRIADGDIASWNNKLNKVSGATEGNVATLDANGNLVDSGVNFNPSTNTMSVNISGKASSADSASATTSGPIQANDDLNSYNAANRNYICNADKASTVSNKPSGASGAFELEVIRGTGDTCVQIYYSRDDLNFNYIRKRTGINNAWTDWAKLVDSSHTHTVKINGVTKTISATGGAAVDLGTYLTSHQAVSDSNPTLAWGTTSTIGTVGGKALRVTMPSNPASGKIEDFFALVTQSTFEDVKAAYNAGKRIVGVLGGTTSSGNSFRQETPLAFVVFAGDVPFSFVFLFENARPKTESGDGLGSTNRWTLSSSGWATSTDQVDYAVAAGTANMAAKLSTVDTAPKKGSSNMVTSDGLWNDTPSPIAYYFDSTGIIGIYNDSRRADEVVIRNCSRFRLTTSWLKNFSGRTFKIHNAMSANLEISVQVEAGLKLLLTDELNSSVKTYDNTSGSSSAETRRVLFLLPGETLRLYVIYTSGTTDVALFIVGSGRWSVFSPPYDRYRRVESITRYQRFSYAKTSGSPSNKGNVHLYDGKNWHNLCNVTSSATTAGTVVIAGLDSSRTPDNPVEFDTVDGLMPIVTGLTLTRNGYIGILHGYVAPKQSIALRLPTASSDTATSYYQSGKTLANCSELRINGFDTDAVGAGHAVFTAGSLLHITLQSGTLTFAIAGDFSVFTTGASYFFSIPLSFGNLKG